MASIEIELFAMIWMTPKPVSGISCSHINIYPVLDNPVYIEFSVMENFSLEVWIVRKKWILTGSNYYPILHWLQIIYLNVHKILDCFVADKLYFCIIIVFVVAKGSTIFFIFHFNSAGWSCHLPPATWPQWSLRTVASSILIAAALWTEESRLTILRDFPFWRKPFSNSNKI